MELQEDLICGSIGKTSLEAENVRVVHADTQLKSQLMSVFYLLGTGTSQL